MSGIEFQPASYLADRKISEPSILNRASLNRPFRDFTS